MVADGQPEVCDDFSQGAAPSPTNRYETFGNKLSFYRHQVNRDTLLPVPQSNVQPFVQLSRGCPSKIGAF